MAHNAEFVGREFVRQYNIILNKSPENLYRFFYKTSQFEHDDIDSPLRRTISANGRYGVRDYMKDFVLKYQHRSTIVRSVQTLDTIGDGIVVQVTGEIAYNNMPLRPYSQTFILCAESPFHYFLSNDIFRYTDFAVTEECAPASNSTELSESSFMDDSDYGMYIDQNDADVMNWQSKKLKDIIIRESQPLSRHALINQVPPTESPAPEKLTWSEEMEECDKEQARNHAQMFQDKCILTIGKRINPNIQFDETKDAPNTNQASCSKSNNEPKVSEPKLHASSSAGPDKPFVILARPTVIQTPQAGIQPKITTLKRRQENPPNIKADMPLQDRVAMRSDSPIVIKTENQNIANAERPYMVGVESPETFSIENGIPRTQYPIQLNNQKSQPLPSKMDKPIQPNADNSKKTKTHEKSKRKPTKTEDKSVGTDSSPTFKGDRKPATDRDEEKTPPKFVSTAIQCDSPTLNPFLPTTVTTVVTPSTTFADLVRNQNGDDSFITDESIEPPPSRRYSAPFSRADKPRLQRGLSFRNDRDKFSKGKILTGILLVFFLA